MSVVSIPLCKKNNPDLTMDCENIQIEIFEKVEKIEVVWSKFAGENIFLSTEYLRNLEENPADGIIPYYVIIKSGKTPVGIAYFQWKYFRLNENIRENKDAGKNITEKFKRTVIKNINFPTLICGNLLLTGTYGFVFSENIDKKDQWAYLDHAIASLTEFLHKHGKPVGLVIAKDFYTSFKESISQNSFIEFIVQPTMAMEILPEWQTLDDYINALKSKYRVRFKKAKKDSSHVIKKEFNADEIQLFQKNIYDLYENISNDANFNTFMLHENYFTGLKKHLGDNLTFMTYWLDDKMVGFYTTIGNGNHLSAHFLGYDKSENKDCHLYLNMLYDIVEQAIHQKKSHIDFSRTAIEIKSTIGAVDFPLYLYIKHINPIWNKVVSPVLNLVKPKMDYIIRHPFK